jgi:hypothetical protein
MRKLMAAVVKEWAAPGEVPAFQEMKRNELRRDWPALTAALDALAAWKPRAAKK